MIEITIPLKPITKKNSMQIIRVNGFPRIIPSKAFKQYELDCGFYLNRYSDSNISEPINLKAVYYMPTKNRVDLCNLLAATCDILTHYKVIKDDDHKIVVSHDGSRVLYDKVNPRVEITIEEVNQ